MKPEEQRIAIAEFCGMTRIEKSSGLMWDHKNNRALITPGSAVEKARLKHRLPYKAGEHTVPDYLNDLNASIPLLDRLSYECWKIDIQRRSDDSAFGPWFVGVFKGPTFACAQAETLACAICEVFLKVYGRWTDETPH